MSALLATAVAVAGLSGVTGQGPAGAADAPGTWHTTGALTVARFGNTITVLLNGKILVAGGGTATAEVYDPATGQSTPTGPMSTTRSEHTATLLLDGKVLVVGGRGGDDVTTLSSAEVYDPDTGRWSMAGTVPGAPEEAAAPGRARHTATRLPNGSVLVAGGFRTVSGRCTDTLEVCEAVSSTAIYTAGAQEPWQGAEPMPTVRARHSATLLQSGKLRGKLLVAGGAGGAPDGGNYDDATTGSTAYLFDLSDGWTPTGALAFNRSGHSATVLSSGKILVAGGLNCATSPPRLPQGSINLCGTTASSEIYDPDTGVWSPASSLNNRRLDHTATLLDGPACDAPAAASRPTWCGKVVAAGGLGARLSAELFDPRTTGKDDAGRPVEGAWVQTGSLVEDRDNHTATYLGNGQLLTLGGNTSAIGVELFQAASTLRRPSVVALEPASGPTSGHSRVVIRGAGFSDVTAVKFGERHATFYRVDSAKTITAASPPTDRTQSVHVTVTVGSGETSVTTEADRFTYEAPNGTWSATGSMGTPRSHHTAAALGDGTILVAGGRAGGSSGPSLRSSELYDPRTKSWRPTGPMNQARAGHTATVLGDGSVLVVGGGPETSEIYKDGTWTTERQLHEVRATHTATLLKDGTVLVAGEGTSEIYDPLARAWTTERQLKEYRYQATATRLTDGSVLVAGGETNTSEIYDADEHMWKTEREMNESRFGHTATLLPDGRILVSGGTRIRNFDTEHLNTSEIYDPASHSWTQTAGKLSQARGEHTATDLGGGRVLVAGGGTASAELYDFTTGRWSTALPLLAARSAHTATVLPGADKLVLVAGGTGTDSPRLASAELFDPSASEAAVSVLSVTPSVGTTSGGSSVVIIGSGFFHRETKVAFGGIPTAAATIASDREIIATTPAHAPGSVDVRVSTPRGTATGSYAYGLGAWSFTSPLDACSPPSSSCTSRLGHTATALVDGKVLVVGGQAPGGKDLGGSTSSSKNSSAQLYDPATERWVPTGSMEGDRISHTATLLSDGTVLVVGRRALPSPVFNSVARDDAEVYQPQVGQWVRTGPVNVSRDRGHTATRLDDGSVLLAGGIQTTGSFEPPIDASELYDPRTRQWSSTVALATARHHHTATLLRDGRVLITGGNPGRESVPPTSTDPQALNSVEVYDRAGKTRTTAGPSLGVARSVHTATLLDDGRVLVAGGRGADGAGLASAEVFHPGTGTWTHTAPLLEARSGHTATKLPGGKVLVTGGAINGSPLSSSEIYDPSTGAWSYAGLTGTLRGPGTLFDGPIHAAALLSGPHCGAACGRVLVTGGRGVAGRTAEIFYPFPEVSAVAPAHGPSAGGSTVVITGQSLAGATAVSFGDVPAGSFRVDSPTKITAVSPLHEAGTVEVVVTAPGGSSLSNPPRRNEFTFVSSGVPGKVTDLAAKAVSEAGVELTWTTAGSDGVFGPPATRYVIKESSFPIDSEAAFAAASSVCDGPCSFPVASLGRSITFSIDGLAPGTGYHYALRAVGPNGVEGPISNPASATTGGTAPVLEGECPGIPAPRPGELVYRSGYSMVGLPSGTRVDAESPLYGWFDLGARGGYTTQPGGDPVAEGRGYWAWFSCPRLVSVAGPGTGAVDLPLGGYRASMVGNPSGTEAVAVSGHDFAARWDPSLNQGTGGYHISGYREQQTLPVGEATWVFSYRDTTIKLRAGPT